MIEKIYKLFLKYPNISTDSRTICKNSIFFALKGENFNGNQFAKQALENGAQLAIIDDKNYFINNKKYILVENTLATLQKLANYHRKILNIPIIAITGSNGKTTTKNLIYTLLKTQYNVKATKENFNNHIGVPLTLLAFNNTTEIGIVEMGANHPGEIKLLCKIAEPNYAIITNIGAAHLKGFKSISGVINTKNELYKFVAKNKGTIIVNSNNKILMQLIHKLKYKNIVSYGTNINNDCYANLISSYPFIKLKLFVNKKTYFVNTRLPGKYNFENILAAITTAQLFNIKTKNIITTIENYIPQNNRSQLITTKNKNTIFLDAYNANPSSMLAALEYFIESKHSNKILILGDMLELGKFSLKYHNEIINFIKKHKFKDTFLVGHIFSSIIHKYNYKYKYFKNPEKLIEFLSNKSIKNSFIMIKGSRKIQLEKLVNYL